MAYHIKYIEKGVIGEFSKINEEFEELLDAFEQDDKVLQICELTDLIGAISEYSNKHFNLTMDDLYCFSLKTKHAFINGER